MSLFGDSGRSLFGGSGRSLLGYDSGRDFFGNDSKRGCFGGESASRPIVADIPCPDPVPIAPGETPPAT